MNFYFGVYDGCYFDFMLMVGIFLLGLNCVVIFELYDIFCIIVMWFDKDYSGMIDRWGD